MRFTERMRPSASRSRMTRQYLERGARRSSLSCAKCLPGVRSIWDINSRAGRDARRAMAPAKPASGGSGSSGRLRGAISSCWPLSMDSSGSDRCRLKRTAEHEHVHRQGHDHRGRGTLLVQSPSTATSSPARRPLAARIPLVLLGIVLGVLGVEGIRSARPDLILISAACLVATLASLWSTRRTEGT